MQRPPREKLLFFWVTLYCLSSTLFLHLVFLKELVFRHVSLLKLTCIEFWKPYLGGIGWLQDTAEWVEKWNESERKFTRRKGSGARGGKEGTRKTPGWRNPETQVWKGYQRLAPLAIQCLNPCPSPHLHPITFLTGGLQGSVCTTPEMGSLPSEVPEFYPWAVLTISRSPLFGVRTGFLVVPSPCLSSKSWQIQNNIIPLPCNGPRDAHLHSHHFISPGQRFSGPSATHSPNWVWNPVMNLILKHTGQSLCLSWCGVQDW